MSAWGNRFGGRSDVVGRIMRAIEQRANGYHNTTEWSDQRADGEWEKDPDESHPSMLDDLEREIKEIIAKDKGEK